MRNHASGCELDPEDQDRTEHRQSGEDQPNAVGPPAPPLAVTDGAKKMARPAVRTDFVAEGDSVRAGISLVTAVSSTANSRRRQSRPLTRGAGPPGGETANWPAPGACRPHEVIERTAANLGLAQERNSDLLSTLAAESRGNSWSRVARLAPPTESRHLSRLRRGR